MAEKVNMPSQKKEKKKKRKKSRMKPLQIPAMTVQYRRLTLTVTENFRKQ